MSNSIISDIQEAIQIINTNKLECLVWEFNNCPLNELKHYIPKGKEELVIVCHKQDNYLAHRLTYDNGQLRGDLNSDFNVTLDFDNDYAIHVIINIEDDN